MATGDDVAATLTKLGIDTAATPRVDADNKPLPASYSPLGKKRTLTKKSELFLAGLPLSASAADQVNLLKFEPGVSNVPGVPNSPDRTRRLPASALDASWKSSAFNAAAACDVDGDGLDETALLWWSASDNAIRLKFIGDQDEAFAESPVSVLGTVTTPSQLKLVCADFDGDGSDDMAFAVANDTAGSVTLELLGGSKGSGYSVDGALRKTFAAPQAGARLGLELATGQLDHDAGVELGVVFNATWGSGRNASPGTGRADYFVYDDRGAAFAQLTTGRVAADVGAATHNGVTANIAIGDIDGNGLDNVVLAALTRFSVECEAIEIVQFALGDAVAGFRNLGATFARTGKNSCESGGNNGHVEHLWVHTLDIDGDQIKEIVVNTHVYEDFKNAAQPWVPMMVDTGGAQPVAATIPQINLYKTGSGGNSWARVTRDFATMAVGDVTADGREDILIHSSGFVPVARRTSGNTSFDVAGLAVTVWGIDPVTGRWGKGPSPNGSSGHMGLLYLEGVDHTVPRLPGAPIVLPVNVDRDSTMLKFEEGSHRVVFSEPIVHAALAAPPCWGDGSQVSDDCRTSWGKGSSSGVNASVSHEITARVHKGVSGGVSLPIVGDVGVEVEKSVGVSLKAEASLGYELTRTVTYTTGPMEDTVVATVIPYDQYTYRILSHPVYPQLVGKDMVISLPRSPRTMQIERRFYNDSLVGSGLRIDGNVFGHTIGNPKSYPTRSQMLSVSGTTRLGPQSVGASSGNQSVEISESLVGGFTTTVGVSYETSVKATGGKVMAGFSVGSTTEASLGFSVGSQVSFTGTVGDMPPASFSLDKAYKFGMFVYKQNPGGDQRPFQVINYWVE
ncbi:MAG: VCBS repeat-containing protein [Rubrivivax sp.]|nr:VCBS repeat-containing protein [Rubrivivax sp.]